LQLLNDAKESELIVEYNYRKVCNKLTYTYIDR